MSVSRPRPLFMGEPVPPEWDIRFDAFGRIDLVCPNSIVIGIPAHKVITRIRNYWKYQNEQHRLANQTPRGSTAPERAAGDTGGTQARGSPKRITSVSITTNGASQGTGVTDPYVSMASAYQALRNQMSLPSIGLPDNPSLFAQLNQVMQQALDVEIERAKRATTPLPVCPATAGEIVGYRCWIARDDTLVSVSAMTYWKPHTPMTDTNWAGQKIGDHNDIGVWAFRDPYRLMEEFSPGEAGYHKYVYGTVWMWGTVIEHEHGYRAQYASIRSLDHGPDLDVFRAKYLSSSATAE